MPMLSENPWYVMFGSRRVFSTPTGKSAQTINYFRTEDEAKAFARDRLEEGHTVQGGTTPGVEPIKMVRPDEAAAWCAEKD
jgi:hypothetical protein